MGVEFGRLPLGQGDPKDPATLGRDHGPNGFTTLLAGGGVQRGAVYGATDELGNHAAENPVSVHDYHATMLHLLGMNYRDLVFNSHGLKERRTDWFPARVIQDILASAGYISLRQSKIDAAAQKLRTAHYWHSAASVQHGKR